MIGIFAFFSEKRKHVRNASVNNVFNKGAESAIGTFADKNQVCAFRNFFAHVAEVIIKHTLPRSFQPTAQTADARLYSFFGRKNNAFGIFFFYFFIKIVIN